MKYQELRQLLKTEQKKNKNLERKIQNLYTSLNEIIKKYALSEHNKDLVKNLESIDKVRKKFGHFPVDNLRE